ncbi:MAG TPA: ATP-binding protein [Ktedonobacteraceae bacterium]|jgi:signal transduction histidine kinase|nr:ATP-binding protein [Ktedonobacteraceae bacterium]
MASTNKLAQQIETIWTSPRIVQLRAQLDKWTKESYSGPLTMLVGTLLATLFIMIFNREVVVLVNPGLIYLPVIAMLAYHWQWRLAVIGGILALFCVYFFFIPPFNSLKLPGLESIAQLATLAAVMGFMLVIVQLARYGRTRAIHAAERLAALNRIGTALISELDEKRLLRLIAQTARDLTGASFAAFTLRPVNEMGEPLVPSEGNFFHLAAVIGVTPEQERLFQRMPLGGEGLLAPIFRHGVPVRVPDALTFVQQGSTAHGGKAPVSQSEYREEALQAASHYAQGHLAKEGLKSMGVPRGHPIIRSFLGVPLLDHNGNVRGGLLLGHTEPDQFTQEDEELLVGLSSQAAVALENARLYMAAQMRASELDSIFESIAEGITLVDEQGKIQRENRTSLRLREQLAASHTLSADTLLQEVAQQALHGEMEYHRQITIPDDSDPREYSIHAVPMRAPTGPLKQSAYIRKQRSNSGAVVVWRDITEAQRLFSERQAHAETETRRALLQTILDELPGSVYLVRGPDARLVLANKFVDELWGAHWPQGQPMQEFLENNGIRVFHSDGRPLATDEFATLRAVRNGCAVHHHQETIRHPDGTTLPVLMNAVPLNPRILSAHDGGTYEEMEPVALIIQQDVTPLKEAERVKDEFIGIAAHELRTPLAVIKGFAQMLLLQTARGKGATLDDWQLEAIQDIDQGTSRLVELTEDLLDVTRLQAGRLQLQIEPTDLVALAQRVIKRVQVTTNMHTISLEASAEYIVSEVDARRTEQVLTNLLNNAIKYSPDGGKIEVKLREDDEHAQAILSIRDYGIGIPENQQSRIFSRFMRADNTRARNIGGTGLGLYLSRELVERQGGRIWFESVEGQGSTFYVSLPLTEV